MRGITAAVISAFFFGVVSVTVSAIGRAVPTFTLSFLRAFISLLVIALVVSRIGGKIIRPKKSVLKEYGMIGLFLAFSILLFNWALVLIPPQNVAFLDQLYTPFVFLVAYFLLREKPSLKEVAAITVAFIGFAMMNPLQPALLLGNLMVVANTVFFALAIAFMRHVDREHSIETIFWIMLFASIFLFPAALVSGLGTIPVVLVLLMGLANASAYLFMTYALERIEADTLSAVGTIMMPLSTVILAFLFLSSVPEPQIALAGAIIIIAGLMIKGALAGKKHGKVI